VTLLQDPDAFRELLTIRIARLSVEFCYGQSEELVSWLGHITRQTPQSLGSGEWWLRGSDGCKCGFQSAVDPIVIANNAAMVIAGMGWLLAFPRLMGETSNYWREAADAERERRRAERAARPVVKRVTQGALVGF